MITCPECGAELDPQAKVCRHCLHVLDRETWWQAHDAGRPGADDRSGGHPIEDPPIGPIPLSGSGMSGGMLGSAVRLLSAGWLVGRRRSKD